METKDIVKIGLGKLRFFFSALFAGAGIVFFCLAFWGNYTLELAGVILPQWVFYVIAGLTVLFGSIGIKDSFRTPLCAKCHVEMRYAEAIFPQDKETDVAAAYETLDSGKLSGLPPYAGKGMSVTIALDYCAKCRAEGILSVHRIEDRTHKPLLRPLRVVEQDTVTAFLEYLRPCARLDDFIPPIK